jgi:hypothetical protein
VVQLPAKARHQHQPSTNQPHNVVVVVVSAVRTQALAHARDHDLLKEREREGMYLSGSEWSSGEDDRVWWVRRRASR